MKKYIGQPEMINKINKDLIKDIVSKNSPISKPQIAKITKLSLPTVNKIVDAMVSEGMLKTAPTGESGVGRKAVFYEMNGAIGYIIALYIENEYSNGYMKGALVDLLGNIVHREDRKIEYGLEAKGAGSLYDFIDSLLEKAGGKEYVRVISIGIPGVTDDEGNIYRMPNIPQWEGVNLKGVLQKHYDIPTYVENDVNLTAVGTFRKYFQDTNENMVYIYLGEGIGTGIILRGKLYKGKNNFAGEISHMIVSTPRDNSLKEYKDKGLFSHECFSLIDRIMKGNKAGEVTGTDCEPRNLPGNENLYLLIQKISYAIINMIALLNPEVVAVKGVVFSEQILREIENTIIDYIGKRNCPKLFLLQDSELGLEGTIKLGLSYSTSNYSFINDKGV